MQVKKVVLISLLLLYCLSSFSQQRFIASISNDNPEVLSTIQSLGLEIVNVRDSSTLDVLLNGDQFQVLQKLKLNPEIRTTEQELIKNLSDGLRLEGYRSYDEILAVLQNYVIDYPEICTLYDIGNSTGKAYFEAGYAAYENYQHDIWALKISDNPEIEEDEPSLLFDAAHHARETISVEVVMNFAKHILENYNLDPSITETVNSSQIWVVPMVNPDGYKIVIDTLEIWWRKTIRDNNGNHQIDPFIPDWIEPDGVDPNRNYGTYWGGDWNSTPTYKETYNGPFSFSEPCIQALRDLMFSHHFVTELSYHSYGERVFYPWAHNTQSYNTPDFQLYQTLGNMLATLTPKLSAGNYSAACIGSIARLTGSNMDYAYGREGIISYTVELAQDFIPPPEDIIPVCEANLISQLYLLGRVHESILTGHVKDAVTNTPIIAKVFIEGIDNNPNGRYDFKSDSMYGRFYRLLNPGDYQVTFSAFGYESLEFSDVNINSSGPSNLEVLLEPADSFNLSGYVADDEGYPIQGAHIVVLNTPVDTLWTDENGEFELVGFYAGTFEVQVSADRCFTIEENATVNENQNTLTFVLDRYELIDFEEEEVMEFFDMSGYQDWTRTDTEAFDGQYSLVAPLLSTNRFASTSLKLYFETDVFMSLATKVSYDSLTQGMIFTMDEKLMKTYYWINDWASDTFFIPRGFHQFKWSVSRGYLNPGPQYENRCWIDLLEFHDFTTIIQEHEPGKKALFSVYPNPSTDVFNFTLAPEVGKVYFMGIYNQTGELIEMLNVPSASPKQLNWNGTNAYGDQVPKGVYLLKMVTDRGVSTEKLLKN